MKRIRGLTALKPKTVKEMKVRTPRRHIRKGHRYDSYSYDQRTTWCGISIGASYIDLPTGDTVEDENHFIFSLRLSGATKYCSCCDNAITRAIRQRMLGI